MRSKLNSIRSSPGQQRPGHVQGLGERTRRLCPIEELEEPDKTFAYGTASAVPTAALSGSHPKAPGSAGGYLLQPPFRREAAVYDFA
jgi:hypothetical protein